MRKPLKLIQLLKIIRSLLQMRYLAYQRHSLEDKFINEIKVGTEWYQFTWLWLLVAFV